MIFSYASLDSLNNYNFEMFLLLRSLLSCLFIFSALSILCYSFVYLTFESSACFVFFLKSYSAPEGGRKVPSHHHTIHIPSINLKTKSMFENYAPASGTLLPNGRPSAHFANAAEARFRQNQVPEMHQNLQLVTLLRDTRKILIVNIIS